MVKMFGESCRLAQCSRSTWRRGKSPRLLQSYFVKDALTLVSAFIVTVHALGSVPVQAPLQPANDKPAGGWARKATAVPTV
jgi:hypothetical protein